MALLRIKMEIVHAARGKVITSVQLETTGINIPFLHMRFSFNQAIFKMKYYSSEALGFKTAKNDDMCGAGRG